MWAMFSRDMQKEVDEYNTLKKILIRLVVLAFAVSLIISAMTCKVVEGLLVRYLNQDLLVYSSVALFFVYVGVLVASYVFGDMYSHTRKIILEVSSEHPRWEWLAREYNETDMRALYNSVKKLHEAVSEQSRMNGIAEIAARVAHDLRSPLVTLSMAIQSIKGISEAHYRLIQGSTQRINDIADDLLKTYRKGAACLEEQVIGEIGVALNCLIEEKKIQHQNASVEFKVKFHGMTDSVFLKVSQTEFISMISNLMDNAIEAIDGRLNGCLLIATDLTGDMMEIIISDNGAGFSLEHLEEIKGGRYSTKKANGNGLGLKNAINCVVNKWGGSFDIQSTLGLGTTIKIRLKISDQ